ncbi:MAG: S-layer homology domain-containing protein [Oscillospiraceae bacterium]|mgnify:CR=1 FL=1
MKKLLALVLALVMSMSLVTISNAAFKDADKIDYKEAVDVMNAVGVFIGDEKGNFNAKENLTREQAAKIIAYLELGSKAADALVGGATFTDVASSRWSAGFVGYCAQAGIVSGVGDSKFDPAGQLTALQFGKMLLVELGYDAKAEGMVGTDWAINTSKLMAGTKLMDGISGSVNQVLTREKAAQMCLNALEAPMVTYDTKGSTITVDGTKINFGASVAKYETSTVAKDQNISKEKLTSGEYTVELGEKLYKDLKKNSTTDAFERPATEWMLKAKSIGTYADAADLSYTATVEIGTIYSDLGLSKGIDDSKVTYYEDGRNQSSTWTQDIVKGSKVEKGGNGTLLEVYYNDDAESLTVIAINTYVGKITASYKASTTKDAYVTFTAKTGAGSSYETDDSYSKDDIVLYTYSGKAGDAGVKSMALAEKVTGKMNGFTAEKNVTVDGTTYKKSANGTSITPGMNTSVGKDVTVYLDQYGYAAFVDADDTLQYAVILAYEKGSRLESARAKLLFTDGTTKKVDVKALKKNDGTTVTPVNLDDYASANSDLNQYDVVSYTVNSDEEYTLTLAADARDAAVGSAKITKGIPSLAGTVSGNAYNVGTASSGVLYANGKTTFLVIDESGTDTTYTSYAGIANVPNIEWKGGTYTAPITLLTEDNTIAKIVVVAKTKVSGETNNLYISDGSKAVTFIKGGSAGQSYTKELGYYYEYDAIIDGAESKIKTDFAVTNYSILTGVSYNSKGVASGYGEIASMDINNPVAHTGTNLFTAVGTEATTNSVVKIGAKLYAFDDDCKVYYIGTDGTLIASAPASIGKDTNDQVWFKLTDGLLSTVFIKVVDETSAVNPSNGTVAVKLVKDASGKVTLRYTNSDAAAVAYTGTVTITNTTNGYVTTVDLVGGKFTASTTSFTDAETIAVSSNSAVKYQATVTVGGAVLTTNSVIGG